MEQWFHKMIAHRPLLHILQHKCITLRVQIQKHDLPVPRDHHTVWIHITIALPAPAAMKPLQLLCKLSDPSEHLLFFHFRTPSDPIDQKFSLNTIHRRVPPVSMFHKTYDFIIFRSRFKHSSLSFFNMPFLFSVLKI